MNWSTIHCQLFEHAPDLFALSGAAVDRIKCIREALEDRISWHRSESIVKLILHISSFQVFEQPVA
jgi:hypothetical protein